MTTKKDKPASIQKEYRKVSQLKNWDKNPRNIKEKDFERLKTQIRDLKQYKPLLITDDGIVLGGNMRLRAYRDLGTEEVWVSVVDAPDEETKMRYALSDNDRAGYYDGDMLANLTGEYPDFNWEDYAVDLNEPQTLDELIKSLAPIEEDEVPEVSDEPAVSKLGEVYQLGRHRLMCGDATKIEDVEKLMDGQKADMVFTDPPYGVNYEGGVIHGNSINNEHKRTRLENDDVDIYKDFIPLIKSVMDNGAVYIFYATRFSYEIFKALKDNQISVMSVLAWIKINTGYADMNSHYKNRYEPFVYCKVGDNTSFIGDTTENTTWEMNKDRVNTEHPTQKPIEVCVRAIRNHNANIVLDLFGGSGSTLIACEQTNRTCYMMELDPRYIDVIIKRWEQFTGNKAEKVL